MRKMVLSLLVAAALVSAASLTAADPGGASPGKAEDVAYDVLIVRPASWFYLATGFTMYVPAAVVTRIAGKDTDALQEELVSKRYRYAAERPWGRF
ncbi:MAG: hypothetical protein HYY66_12165 [Candidatus Tectomicrobia bacterium]|nr:hypothetical protein [Candidatus Tectomicrobia bacterium]MBI3026408.1 hypothetical protein [Candidatus Tectomicrobia bacterium]